MPDAGYQQWMNRMELGSGKTTDGHIMLSKEKIKSVKKYVFAQVDNIFQFKALDEVSFHFLKLFIYILK